MVYCFLSASDLGVACLSIHAVWSIIIIWCFHLIERFSSLRLNNDNTQFLLTSNSTFQGDIVAICGIDSMVSPSQFGKTVKYLGIWLGSNILDANWNALVDEYIGTYRFVGSLDCGLLTKISLYIFVVPHAAKRYPQTEV